MKNFIIYVSIVVFVTMALLTGCSQEAKKANVVAPSPTKPEVTYAGVRSSCYGIKPFPEPAGWEKALDTMTGYFEGSTPCAVWIVGVLERPKSCLLEFPSDGNEYENIVFSKEDKHERYLDYFDKAGIKVFLQVESANGDVETLMDLVLKRYMHHPCVIGFGVDVEWYREFDNPKWGVKVGDALAEKWEKHMKSHNPNYQLFLKHWDRLWMPPTYRGDILFISDSQMLKDENDMYREFVDYWAKYFAPNPVGFQIGYGSDEKWWSKFQTPPKDMGEGLSKRIPQEVSIFWVDFTLRKVLPTG